MNKYTLWHRKLTAINPLVNIYAVQQDTQSFLMTEFYSSHMLARHVSDLTGPSSGAFFLQAVCADLVCGNTRTTRHVQSLRSCRKNLKYM